MQLYYDMYELQWRETFGCTRCDRNLSHLYVYTYFPTTYQNSRSQVICKTEQARRALKLLTRNDRHVDFRVRRNWARAEIVKSNGIFRAFSFSGILGQPPEVVHNFRSEFPETFCSIWFCTGISGNFGQMDRAHSQVMKKGENSHWNTDKRGINILSKSKNAKASLRACTRNDKFECDWLISTAS